MVVGPVRALLVNWLRSFERWRLLIFEALAVIIVMLAPGISRMT